MTTPVVAVTKPRIQLDQVINQIRDLPALSEVVQDLLQRDDIDINVLTSKISLDQALAAKTLRLANSSFYTLQAKVTTIQQAIALIGVDAVRHVATAAMGGQFSCKDCVAFDAAANRRHAIATAVCARVLARHLHVNQDYAFTAGLLHNVGRLVLATYFCKEYEEVIAYRNAHDCQWLEAEQKVMGVDHVMAGAALAEFWNFSDTIRFAIAGYHKPEDQKVHSLASIVHVANAIAIALDLSGVEDDLLPPVSLVAWEGLGLSDEVYRQVFQETESQFDEVRRVLLSE